ncbi:Thioredoxin-like 4 chloroplastic [Bienertia sinuspersici]
MTWKRANKKGNGKRNKSEMDKAILLLCGALITRYKLYLMRGNTCISAPRQLNFRTSSVLVFRPRNPDIINGFNGFVSLINGSSSIKQQSLKSVPNDNQGYSLDEDEDDDDVCPVECVKEFKTDEEFMKILDKSKKSNALVVVDFYRTSCGSCKYIEQGFSKLCKASGEDVVPVIFLKHNVIDEYDEQSETVPLFHFYKNGVLLEAFATRDKERITEAVYRYMSSPAPQESTN